MGNSNSNKYSYDDVQKYISIKNKIRYENEQKILKIQKKNEKKLMIQLQKKEREDKEREREEFEGIYGQNQTILGNITEEDFEKMSRNVIRTNTKNRNQHFIDNHSKINYNPEFIPKNVVSEEFPDIEEELDEDILIIDFQGKKYNSMKILGLDLDTDDNQLRKKYFKLCQKYHPDKGGNPRKFMIIQKCYEHLKRLMNNENHNHQQMKDNLYIHNETSGINKEKIIDAFGRGDNFNSRKFNKIFNKTRISNPYDKGYGEFMNNEYNVHDETIKQRKDLGSATSLNHEAFSNEFNRRKAKYRDKSAKTAIQVFEPAVMNIKSLGFQELGRGEIDNFTSGDCDKLQFTDYKKAYQEASVLINPNDVQKRKNYRNMNEYKAARSNLSLSVQEKTKIKNIEKRKKIDEIRRRKMLRRQDLIEQRKYQHLNKLLLKNSR